MGDIVQFKAIQGGKLDGNKSYAEQMGYTAICSKRGQFVVRGVMGACVTMSNDFARLFDVIWPLLTGSEKACVIATIKEQLDEQGKEARRTDADNCDC